MKALHVDSILNPKPKLSNGPIVTQSIQAGKSPPQELKLRISSRTDELTAVVKLVAEQQRMSLLPAQEPPDFLAKPL